MTDRYVELRYPICGFDIARIAEDGTTDKGEPYMVLDLGKLVCRMLSKVECVQLSHTDPKLLRFGKRREQSKTPYAELIPVRELQPETAELLYDDAGNAYSNMCLCGCGAKVARAFLPGHDAKLKSRLSAILKLGDDASIAIEQANFSPSTIEYIMTHWSAKYGKLFA